MSAPLGVAPFRTAKPSQGPPPRNGRWLGEFTRSNLTIGEAEDLRLAATSSAHLVEQWPRIRELLDRTAQAVGFEPLVQTPVMSAPIVRLLCSIAASHHGDSNEVLADRFSGSVRDVANLAEGAAGETRGPLMDWPQLGGFLYSIADQVNAGGIPHAGDFHRTLAEGGAFRLLCRLLLEHVDATD